MLKISMPPLDSNFSCWQSRLKGTGISLLAMANIFHFGGNLLNCTKIIGQRSGFQRISQKINWTYGIASSITDFGLGFTMNLNEREAESDHP